jgi:hypothetical protein
MSLTEDMFSNHDMLSTLLPKYTPWGNEKVRRSEERRQRA